MEDARFDFGDGLGPVPAHRHVNGGGWVAYSAVVMKSVWVGPEAQVYGHAWVMDTVKVVDRARVHGRAYLRGDVTVAGEVDHDLMVGVA